MSPPTGYFGSTDGSSTLRQFADVNYLLGHVLFAATWAYTRRHKLGLINHPFTGVGLLGLIIIYTVLWPLLFGISDLAFKRIIPMALFGLLLGAMLARVITTEKIDWLVSWEVLV